MVSQAFNMPKRQYSTYVGSLAKIKSRFRQSFVHLSQNFPLWWCLPPVFVFVKKLCPQPPLTIVRPVHRFTEDTFSSISIWFHGSKVYP
jgi:hypothetical protein